ncbi:Phage tail protein [Escherichia coli]
MPARQENCIFLNVQLRESFSGVVGQSRNARMSVTSSTQSATFTADELIVETSTGQQYRLSAFNKTVNLGVTGAGGMDTGTVPSAGFIALYAILNPTNGATALLAVNATAASVPEIYGGANMPAGYTASALVSVWRVASGQFTIGEMMGRQINTPELPLVTVTNTVPALTELSVSAVIPKNARTMEGWGLVNSVAAATNNSFGVSSKPYSIGFKTHGNNNSGLSGIFSNLMLAEPQKIYYQIGFGGTPTASTIYSTGYSF